MRSYWQRQRRWRYRRNIGEAGFGEVPSPVVKKRRAKVSFDIVKKDVISFLTTKQGCATIREFEILWEVPVSLAYSRLNSLVKAKIIEKQGTRRNAKYCLPGEIGDTYAQLESFITKQKGCVTNKELQKYWRSIGVELSKAGVGRRLLKLTKSNKLRKQGGGRQTKYCLPASLLLPRSEQEVHNFLESQGGCASSMDFAEHWRLRAGVITRWLKTLIRSKVIVKHRRGRHFDYCLPRTRKRYRRNIGEAGFGEIPLPRKGQRPGFEEAREVTHTQSFPSREHYKQAKAWRTQHNLPSAPNYTYKDQGWVGWSDFLGSKPRLSWTPQEDDILKKHYENLSLDELTELLPGRTTTAMRDRAGKILGLYRRSRPWSREEDEILQQYYGKISRDEIVDLLPGRPWTAIRDRASKTLGLMLKKPISRWTQREDAILKEYYATTPLKKLMKMLPGRTRGAVESRVSNLKVAGRRKSWAKQEDAILKKHYATATHNELMESLPGRTWNSIATRARILARASKSKTLRRRPGRPVGSRYYRRNIGEAGFGEIPLPRKKVLKIL